MGGELRLATHLEVWSVNWSDADAEGDLMTDGQMRFETRSGMSSAKQFDADAGVD